MTPEERLVGRWVRRRDDGREFQVMYLGSRQRDGRCSLYGRAEVAMLDEVDPIEDGRCDGTVWGGTLGQIGRRCGDSDCHRHSELDILLGVVLPALDREDDDE